MEPVLTENEIRVLVEKYANQVNEGRTIKQLIKDGELPQLKDSIIQEGKVSDSVFEGALKTKEGIPIRLMFRSNRISTHDMNRGAIPFKDQVLAANHHFMLQLVKKELGTAQLEIPGLKPTATVIASENVEIIKIENVIRRYMAESSTSTSLYQHYIRGDRIFCGHTIPDGLQANDKLPYIMDTPSTKDKSDKSVEPKYFFEKGICTKQEYAQIRNSSLAAFGIITEFLRDKGLVLVDTKTEHGKNTKGQIVVADEVYTLDSSRYWKIGADGNFECTKEGKPKSFSKEFARGMVKDTNKQQFTKEQSNDIAVRYIMGYQYITGKRFIPDIRPREQRIIDSVSIILKHLL
jgi:phosphoribosylaminoimidazole-succinocarboxamide synthase